MDHSHETHYINCYTPVVVCKYISPSAAAFWGHWAVLPYLYISVHQTVTLIMAFTYFFVKYKKILVFDKHTLLLVVILFVPTFQRVQRALQCVSS